MNTTLPELSSASSACKPGFLISTAPESPCITLSGDWSIHSLTQIPPNFFTQTTQTNAHFYIDLAGITRLDTAGALVINQLSTRIALKGIAAPIATNNQQYKKLIETAKPVLILDTADGKKGFSFLSTVNELGKHIVLTAQFSLSLISFLGQFLTLFGMSILRPHKIRWTSLFFFMEQVGLRAVPIVSTLCFLIGLVVAFMCMDELAKFGAQGLTIKLLEVTVLREMGVLITSIVVAGRSSSSFTAQIGSMVANEEVAAIQSMGLDPVHLLVLPRVLALVITLPMLVFVADVAGVLGGALVICPVLDLDLNGFLHQFYNGSNIWNFFVAFIKAPFCALAIGLVGCYQGFQATSSAESVGFLTTVAVVQSIFIVILVDAVFAIFFAGLGI